MDTIDSRRKFEKWFKDSLFAECNVPSKEALHDAWCAARAQDGGEPVAWLCIRPDGEPWGAVTNQASVDVWMRLESLGRTVCPLYTHSPSAVAPEPFGTESAYQTAKNPILSSSNMIISSGLVRDLVEALRKALSNASGGSLHDCCCGETEQAWRLCPLHSAPPEQEQES
jgi:hypothetical protein